MAKRAKRATRAKTEKREKRAKGGKIIRGVVLFQSIPLFPLFPLTEVGTLRRNPVPVGPGSAGAGECRLNSPTPAFIGDIVWPSGIPSAGPGVIPPPCAELLPG